MTAIAGGFSCTDKYTEELVMNVPVYMSYDELRSFVAYDTERQLMRPGKICFQKDRIFIVEHLVGVHVIDVSDPANPQNRGFIKIPGCVDIAIKDQALYADSYVDLVTVDISDISNPRETKRLNDVFPYTIAKPENESYPYDDVDPKKGVVVNWEAKRKTREHKPSYGLVYPSHPEFSDGGKYASIGDGSGGGGSSVSIGGSLALFGLHGDYLYAVNNSQLYMFDTKDATSPSFFGNKYLGRMVETLFIYNNHLFFGTPSGMVVYSLNATAEPSYLGEFWHITSCDPVVVQDGYAYITLRAGTACGGGVNRLDVVKISDDYKKYELVQSYGLNNPFGLGIDNNILFVCDGTSGLKVYDATDKERITQHQLAAFPNILATDVIPVNGYLFTIGDGFRLYDYSDLNNIREIGHIPVVPYGLCEVK